MFSTHVGPKQAPQQAQEGSESSSVAYLRPETAQGMFASFGLLQGMVRRDLPWGVGQVGRAFRNELRASHFLFRSREFEQLEIEWFCKPEEEDKW